MVCADSLELEFDITSVGAANRELALLGIAFEEDLVLDHVAVLISTHPSWACPQNRVLIDFVLRLGSSHYDELLSRVTGRFLLMSELVDMVVDDLAEIDERSLVKLQGCAPSDLESGGVDDSQVPKVELSVLVDDGKLTLPKFLVVCYDIVVRLSFTNLKLGEVSIKADL